jgi:ribose 5-phosphate isomerase B
MNNGMKLPIACDHAGYELKMKLLDSYVFAGLEVIDMGTHTEESMDYPDAIHPLAKMVNEGKMARGIIICGSGNGVSMTANKYTNVRAALCWKPEIAELARQHNNANVLSLPARFMSYEDAEACVKAFLDTDFEGGRHERRVNKIAQVC